MANEKGIVNIGLRVDYSKTLKEMTDAFEKSLGSLKKEFEKVGLNKDTKAQFDAVSAQIEQVTKDSKAMFDAINKGKIDATAFEEYKIEARQLFSSIEKDISSLREELRSLNGVDIASGIKSQFDELQKSVLSSYEEISKVFDVVHKLQNGDSVSVIDNDVIKQVELYKKAIDKIYDIDNTGKNIDTKKLGLDEKISKYKKLNDELKRLQETESTMYDKLDDIEDSKGKSSVEYLNQEAKINIVLEEQVSLLETMKKLYREIGSENLSGFDGFDKLSKDSNDIQGIVDTYISRASAFIKQNEKMVESHKETQEQLSTSVTEFKVKNGAIQIPVEINKNENIKEKLVKIIDDLNERAKQSPIIAKVKLVVDGSGKSGYKKNAEIDKQQIDGQTEPEVDLDKSMAKMTRDATRSAEVVANTTIKSIKDILDGTQFPVHLDKEAFLDELKQTLDAGLKDINQNPGRAKLSSLANSLKKLTNTEGFKFGLDEAQIKGITDAIENMAHMIQRAFGVASDSDIANQWTIIEGKFKSVAGEEGKLLMGNKEHKAVIQELATEYKKYLDMGGTNDLSSLTKHTQTIKNITNAYEKLNTEAKETQDVLDNSGIVKGADVKLNPTAEGFKADADKLLDGIPLEKEVKLTIGSTKDDIKSVAKANKNLETQAGKTETAVQNEATIAETASAKFRKLAKEKGAAVVANRELANSAERTANALKKEAEVKKSSGSTKTNKNAVDSSVYDQNSNVWKLNTANFLREEKGYKDVLDAKISQTAKGVVKFTAYVKAADNTWKKFTANLNESGEIISSSATDVTETQRRSIEKRLADIEKSKVLESRPHYSQTEMREFASIIEKSANELDELDAKYKVFVNNRGGLSITKELKEADGTVSVFTADLESVEKVLNTTTKETIDLGKALEETFASATLRLSNRGTDSGAKETTSDIQKAIEAWNEFKDNVHTSKHDSAMAETLEDLRVFSQNLGNEDGLVKFNARLEQAQEELKSLNDSSDYAEKAFKIIERFKYNNSDSPYFKEISDDLEKIRQKAANIGNQDGIDELNDDLKKLKAHMNSFKMGKVIGNGQTFKDINEVKANLNALSGTIGKVNEKSIRITGMNKLTAEARQANGEIHKITVSLDGKGFAHFVDNGIVQFGRLRDAAEGVFKGIRQMIRIYLSPMDFVRYFRQGFDKVKEVNTSMTELRKVSDASDNDLASYFGDAVVSAKELGSSVNNMIAATADWSRMGYNLPDSKELAEVATIYKNVGDGIDIDTANESLISTLQGFQMEADDAMEIIDSFNEVSNNFAISSGGIGEALKRSAAAFNAANTDMNQAIALITAGNEVIQNPEKVGTMWQTVSARIRGTKSELEELGEETDNIISTSKLRDLVKGYTDVDIMKDDNTYKDMYTIIKEIGKEWEKLEDIEQAALLEALAGKKQSNTLAAVLNNYERLEEIYKTAEGSAGSAMTEQQKYMDSIQYSLDQLTAHGEEFWTTFIATDDVKAFIDLINNLILGATKLVDTFGSIPTVAGILGSFAAIKNFGRPKMFGLKLLF